MAKNLLTVAQYASRYHISEQRVRQLLCTDRIPQAYKIGRMWVIPAGYAHSRMAPGRPKGS